MRLTTAAPESDILFIINRHLLNLFPDYSDTTPIRHFEWSRRIFNKSKGSKRDRWAGWYGNSRIGLDPDFFRGITDTAQQHQAIEDVLLHELCHHIQSIKWLASPTHGKEFRELAYYVNGKMGRDAVTIYHSLAKTPEGQEAERAQRKALALLARTTSSNEHEASLAAAKYAQFVAYNNIVLNAHAETLANGLPVIVKEHIWTAKQMTAWLSSLLSAVAYVNSCAYTYIRCNNSYTKIHFYGRPSKISQSYDLLEYLTEAVDRCVKQAQKKERAKAKAYSVESDRLMPEPRGRSYWIAFREGVAWRVGNALREDHKRCMAEGITVNNNINSIAGLVLQSTFEKEHQVTRDFLKEIHPKIGKGTKNRGAASASGRYAGYVAGSSISVARQAVGSAPRSLTAAR